MSTADSMSKVISTLDWVGDLGPASLAVPEAEQLQSRLGDGATRWVAGAVEPQQPMRSSTSAAGHSQSREMHVRTIILSHTSLCTSRAESPGERPWAARRLLPARLALRQGVGTRGGRACSLRWIHRSNRPAPGLRIDTVEPASSSSDSNWMGLEGLRGDRRRPGEGGRPVGPPGADEVHPSRLLAHLPPSYRTPSIAAPAPPKGTMRSSAAG